MTKRTLYRIAEAHHQAALERAEAMAEAARQAVHKWADMSDEQADDMHRRLFDIGGWEEGDDAIIF